MREIQPRFSNARLRAIAFAIALLFLATPARVHAEVVCADDIVPPGTVVTATGTAPSCDGSCRAREIKPVCGLVMRICAGQPIPRGYTLDSITSMPGCQCLGYDDDAYVIRYTGPNGPAAVLSSNADPSINAAARRLPFGNPLCLPNAAQIWLGGGGSGGIPAGPPQSFPSGPYASPQGMVPPGVGVGAAGQSGSPWNNPSNEEPFRVGQ